jgi:hypothetical protein
MDDTTVCPESTIESATQRTHVRKPSVKLSSRSAKLLCESTIESAKRRGFIRSAAVATAAVAAGTILGKQFIPESTAEKSAPNCSAHFPDSVFVDTSCSCNGNATAIYFEVSNGVIGFGCPCCLSSNGSVRGESIGSQRNSKTVNYCCCTFPPGNNLYGLDFYTRNAKRMSITNAGNVGIGTCKPSSQLEVIGTTCAIFGCVASTKCGRHVGVVGKSGSGAGSAGVAGYACGGCDVTAGVYGQSSSTAGEGVSGAATAKTGKTVGVVGSVNSPTGTGVKGNASCGTGVFGCSDAGTAVFGCAGTGVGVLGSVLDKAGTPIVARGAACQVSNLQAWQNHSKTALSVVNNSGWLGIGTSSPATALCVGGKLSVNPSCNLTTGTTLHVCGSMSARIASPTGAYTMSKNDYAVLASGNITLPAANTPGRLVFIKNIGKTAITVSAAGSDHIEGKSSESLSKQYDSLTLISDGNSPGNWYIQSNAK